MKDPWRWRRHQNVLPTPLSPPGSAAKFLTKIIKIMILYLGWKKPVENSYYLNGKMRKNVILCPWLCVLVIVCFGKKFEFRKIKMIIIKINQSAKKSYAQAPPIATTPRLMTFLWLDDDKTIHENLGKNSKSPFFMLKFASKLKQ